MIPAASRRSSRAGSSGCCERAEFAPIAFSSATIAFIVPGGEGIAVAERVGLDARAVEVQRVSVEHQVPRVPGELAQADAGAVGALAGDAQLQLVEARARGRPERGMFDVGDRRDRRGPARGRSAPRANASGMLWPDAASVPCAAIARARAVVGEHHAHPHVGGSGREGRRDRRCRELARADRPHRHLAIEPSPVEPGAVEAFGVCCPGLRQSIRTRTVCGPAARVLLASNGR